jgi:hypothetical protein
MNILGINAYHGNASAALVCDGKLSGMAKISRLPAIR